MAAYTQVHLPSAASRPISAAINPVSAATIDATVLPNTGFSYRIFTPYAPAVLTFRKARAGIPLRRRDIEPRSADYARYHRR